MDNELELIGMGMPPETAEMLDRITVGMDKVTDFVCDSYLKEYISLGGSKIKFITGRKGSGKTHFMRRVFNDDSAEDYLKVVFSAKDIWLYDFRELYIEAVRQIGIEHLVDRLAQSMTAKLGYDPTAIGEGKNLIDFLSEKGEADMLSRGEIRGGLRENFTKNPRLDSNFAGCISLLTGGRLGHPVLEDGAREILIAYLQGDKSVKLSSLRALGLSPSKLTKYNARYMFRSLCETVKLAGYKGLLVGIDDMEILSDPHSEGRIRYTKMRRDDAYENLRQLIDDIDSMRYVMFMLCFDRELIDNENSGFKSYQALWFRIQNEVVSSRFNKLADIIDMDRLAEEFYDEDTLRRMARKIDAVLSPGDGEHEAVSGKDIEEILKKAEFGSLGIPYLINRAVTEGAKRNG